MWHRHSWLCSDDHNRDSTKIDDGPTQRPPQLRINLPAPILEWSLEGSVHWTCLQQSGPRHFRAVSATPLLCVLSALCGTDTLGCAPTTTIAIPLKSMTDRPSAPAQLRFTLPAPILEWSLEGSVHWTCLQQSGPRHFRSVSSVANLFLAFSLPRTAKSVCATSVEVVAAAWGASAHCACSGTGCGAVGASA